MSVQLPFVCFLPVGVTYDPSQLKHPFRERDIVTGGEYEEFSFNVGQLCHQVRCWQSLEQKERRGSGRAVSLGFCLCCSSTVLLVFLLCHSQRLKLYHVMRHFKVHVMLSLKARLKEHSKKCFQSPTPPSKADAYRLLNDMFRRGSVDQKVGKQFHIWERLNTMAQGYSIQDTRKTFVDLEELSGFQSFEYEHTNNTKWRGSRAATGSARCSLSCLFHSPSSVFALCFQL